MSIELLKQILTQKSLEALQEGLEDLDHGDNEVPHNPTEEDEAINDAKLIDNFQEGYDGKFRPYNVNESYYDERNIIRTLSKPPSSVIKATNIDKPIWGKTLNHRGVIEHDPSKFESDFHRELHKHHGPELYVHSTRSSNPNLDISGVEHNFYDKKNRHVATVQHIHDRRRVGNHSFSMSAHIYNPEHFPSVNSTNESEELNELSPSTLGRYIKKAANDMATKSAALTYSIANSKDISKQNKYSNKIDNRHKGIDKAVMKLAKHNTNESEELNELSKSTLGSYIKKSAVDIRAKSDKRSDIDKRAGMISDLEPRASEDFRKYLRKQRRDLEDRNHNLHTKIIKRHGGIGKAVKKLTEEELNG